MVRNVLNYNLPEALNILMSSGGGGSSTGGGSSSNSCSSLSINDGNPKKDPNYCGYFKGKRKEK